MPKAALFGLDITVRQTTDTIDFMVAEVEYRNSEILRVY